MKNEETKTKSLDYSQEASKIKAFQLGAGGRGRTGTVSLPLDFESSTSANSITPAGEFLTLVYYNGFFLKNQH